LADVVNLRRARKIQERLRRQVAAGEARMRHGRPAAERALAELEQERTIARLDAHKLDDLSKKSHD
jgi:Domain of unknown function (DUF4169)